MDTLYALQPQADDAQTLLSDVNSSSKVADWRLWLWIVAAASHLLEKAQDTFRTEIDNKVIIAKSHTLRWYQRQALKFQFGYSLNFDDELLLFTYSAIDLEARIVTRAAVEESLGTVVIKVAGEEGALNTTQFNAFQTYINEIKDAGTDILLISDVADQFKVTLEIFYDPLVLNPDGSLILTGARPVESALENHVKSLPFNAKLNVNALIDDLQAAPGVIDPSLTELQAKSAIASYAVVQRQYTPYAGHYAWDDNNSTITYTPAT